MKTYSGRQLRAIAMPLGGIGTGSVSLAGNGRLVDWEIFNRPDKGSFNEFTHFAVKTERAGRTVDCRVLQGDLPDGWLGDPARTHIWGYGHGALRPTLAGMPHFQSAEFVNDFPFGELHLSDPAFEGTVKLTAFNPFIPSDEDNSSIPAAFFEWKIENRSTERSDYTVAFSCGNIFREKSVNRFFSESGVSGIGMTGTVRGKHDPMLGDLVIACPGNASFQENWVRFGWSQPLQTFWNEFSNDGPLKNRSYSEPGTADMCTLAAKISVEPGETGTVRFVLSWNVPNFVRYWGEKTRGEKAAGRLFKTELPVWKNEYAVRFDSAKESAFYALKNWKSLESRTRAFSDALWGSALPEEAACALASDLAVLKSPTCIRLTDGTFYAFEGQSQHAGSCEGSCTHVWNYAYALAFLFPKLERSMREKNYEYNQMPSGGMRFRLALPYGRRTDYFRPCADGQFGDVVKFYRDWKLCGDLDWLKKYWPKIRHSVEYAWSPENSDRWDPDRIGVLTGRQHHTLDTELIGATSWLAGFYIAALEAAAEMAEAVGEPETSGEFRKIAERGRAGVDRLFNGEYYVQDLDRFDRAALRRVSSDQGDFDKLFDAGSGEIMFQLGDGCLIDQTLADWHTGLVGLPKVFDQDHRKSALSAILRRNFKSMREVANPCRIFAADGEKGVLMCTFPDTNRPVIPISYAEECMSGFEYAFAGQLIACGMEREGLEVVRAVRERYDGEKRNPFGELECGSFYARSLASYAFLPIYSGFEFDLNRGRIGFRPIRFQTGDSFFWSVDGAWGTFGRTECGTELAVLFGTLDLRELGLPEGFSMSRTEVRSSGHFELSGAEAGLSERFATEAQLRGREIAARQTGRSLVLSCSLTSGEILEIRGEFV